MARSAALKESREPVWTIWEPLLRCCIQWGAELGHCGRYREIQYDIRQYRMINIPFTPIRQSPLAGGLRNGETNGCRKIKVVGHNNRDA